MTGKMRYETPTVQTLTAGEVLESMGPVQGYAGSDDLVCPDGTSRIRSGSRVVRD